MNKDFFVMLTTQDGGYTPMMDGDEIAKFEFEKEAMSAGLETVLGEHFGCEVFEIGMGC